MAAYSPMKPIDQHVADVVSLVAPLPTALTPLAEARGLVVSQEVRARYSIPPFTNSAMDGFAVRVADVDAAAGAPLPVAFDVPAGSTDRRELPAGSVARIMTGAPLPTGADAVIQTELTTAGYAAMAAECPAEISFTKNVPVGKNVRYEGEDIQADDVVFAPGTLLGPAELSAMAAIGYATVPVHRRPRIAILTTGDELRDAGTTLGFGQIPDSNSVLVSHMLEEWGGEVTRVGLSTDDTSTCRDHLRELAADVDLMITTGGVSVGAYDVIKAVLKDEGVEFTTVCQQPGKPQGWGRVAGTPVLCFPGNPIGVFVSMIMYARPVIEVLIGRGINSVPSSVETMGAGWVTPPGRAQFMPCRRQGAVVVPSAAGGAGSHLVGSLPRAEGLVVVPAEVEKVDVGDRYRVMWL